jgi:putative glutamine amidotransferase
MRWIGLTQRVDVWSARSERRDAIDQRWVELLAACGCLPLLLPNHLPAAQRMVEQLPLHGFVLTGGGDLAAYGGVSPERDELERWLLDYASARGTPLLGVCRGMQAIQHRWGVPLAPVEGHVATTHLVHAPDSGATPPDSSGTVVSGSASRLSSGASTASLIRRNSYHRYAARATAAELAVTAVAEDGVIEAVAHRGLPIRGIMWHPEREHPLMASDLRMIQLLFRGENEHEHDSW